MDNPPVYGSEWTLTADSFARFLAHLDPDRERAGEKYETLRLTLVKFFDWRGAHFPEDCADETFNLMLLPNAAADTLALAAILGSSCIIL